MTDLERRLHGLAAGQHYDIAVADEAAAEIDRLTAALADARGDALEEAATAFMAAIMNGYETTGGECEHGVPNNQDCIICYDVALEAAVDEMRALARGDHRTGGVT